MNWITLGLLFVVFVVLAVILHFKPKYARLNHLPGDDFSLTRSLDFFKAETGELYMKWLAKYGQVFKYYFAHNQRILVADPDIVKHILVTNQHNYSKRFFTYKTLAEVIGNGLVSVADKDEHHQMRSVIQEAFSYSNLKLYFHIFIEKGLILMKKWEEHAKSKEPVLMQDELFATTLDVIARAAFGLEFNASKTNHKKTTEEDTPIPRYVEKIMHQLHNQSIFDMFSLTRRFTKGARERKAASVLLQQEMSKVIREKQRKNSEEKNDNDNEGDDVKRDLLDILVNLRDENGQPLSDETIIAHCKTFLFAGHDTLEAALLWILYLLGSHSDVMTKLNDEIREKLGTEADVKIPRIEDLDNLKYLNCVVKESMRLYPSVPIVIRKCEETESVNGVLIPEGSIVVVSIYVQHHNPAYWEKPEEFTPERWLNDPKVHPGSYLPFLIGSRNCIGSRFALLEIKAILALLLQKFKVRFPADHPSIKRKSRVTMKPTPYLKLIIEPV